MRGRHSTLGDGDGDGGGGVVNRKAIGLLGSTRFLVVIENGDTKYEMRWHTRLFALTIEGPEM